MKITEIEKQLADKLTEDNDREMRNHAVHTTVLALIAGKWNGKAINKRFIADFKAAYFANHPDGELASVGLEYIAGMCNLCVWNVEGVRASGQRVRCFLGYADAVFRGNGDENTSRSYNYLTPAGFEENDRCNGTAAAERIAARGRLLLNFTGKLARLAIAIHVQKEAQAKVAALLEDKDFSLAGSLPKGLLD